MKSSALLFIIILGAGFSLSGNLYSQSNTNTRGIMGPTPAAPVLVSGKVRMDDGSPLPGVAQIQTICRGQKHTEGHTDSKGNFSFELGRQAAVGEDISNGSGASRPGQASSDMDSMPSMQGQVISGRDFRDCQVQALLPGYLSQVVELVKHGDWGSVDVGTIQIYRSAQVAALVSVTTASAPDSAKKAFEKGRAEEAKRNWEEARKQFAKAVADYPQFAEAWVELGRIQEEQKDIPGAQISFKHASEADPQLAAPYHLLAGIAFEQERWADVIDLSARVIKLSPRGFPADWLYSAASYYSLQRYAEAEQAAREGLKADTQHRFPRLEYLLGVVLVQQHNYVEAIEHMHNYLQLAPNAPDNAAVAQQAKDLEKVAGLSSPRKIEP